MARILGAATLGCLGIAAAFAEEHELGAHLHGAGLLNLAIEENVVEIELQLPGVDVVGFEHGPESQADRAAVEAAVTILKDGEALFAFAPEARCRLTEAEVESALAAEDHDDHAENETAEDHAESDGEAHAEFHSHYRFLCDSPGELTYLDVRLFERFPSLEEIEAQTISSTGQQAQELTAAETRLSF